MKKGFTLAEALFVLILIGTLAAIAVPVLLKGDITTHYKSGVVKAVDTINNAISANIAKGERTAYSTDDLFTYLQKNIEVTGSYEPSPRNSNYKAFRTADKMLFEVPVTSSSTDFGSLTLKNGSCGTKGLGIGGSYNVSKVTPCYILADTNGEKSPNTVSDDENLYDQFIIIITDKNAMPYGTAAQSAFYGN
ncbi:MAG: type II secretion system protein [Candidatus Gastranaerophilales bacterium]|nr:type II secretion system protein [Candidatus Gastranaerophilales bacterium]